MKLLVETTDTSQFKILNEGNGKGLYIEGNFIQTNVENINRRFYPKEVVAPVVEQYITDYVETNAAIGELNHPENPMLNPERACIKIISLVEKGDAYWGKAKILEVVPMGSIVGGLLRENVRLGVSSRALGSVKPNGRGVNIVQPDFKLITAADMVLDPSAPDAFVTALMENREWVYQNGVLIEQEAEIKRAINKVYERGNVDNSKLLSLFQTIITKMESK